MRHPWANVLLLVLLLIEGATGLLGLTSGDPRWAVYLQLHRIAGFAIIGLLLWKVGNVIPSLLSQRHWRRSPGPQVGSLMLLGLLLPTLGLGLAWSHGGRFGFAGFSGLSWHIYIGAAIAPILLWHTVRHRWSLRPRFWAERRSVLRAGGLVVAGLLLWRAGELTSQVAGLPGARRRFTGSYEAGSFSGNGFPRTSWLNDRPHSIDSGKWRLEVRGEVGQPLSLAYGDISTADEHLTATLDCTGGWYTEQQWHGLPLANVLQRAQVLPNASSVTVRSVTGYYRRFSLGEASQYLLATRVGGEPLSHGHGSPLRLVAPGKRGYDWVKWVTSIEVNDTGKWWQPPLPLQ